MQHEIQEYHREQLEKDGIFLPPKEATVLTISGNFTQKDLDKAAKKGTKRQSSRSETIAAPTIEKSLGSEGLSEAIASSDKPKITYQLGRDGSVVLRSLRGITLKALKRMTDAELNAIGLVKTLIGANEKFFPTDEALSLRYQEKELAKSNADKRFTADEAAKYYSEKSGKSLSVSSLRTNAKKYGFMIKEKGSGLYALIDS